MSTNESSKSKKGFQKASDTFLFVFPKIYLFVPLNYCNVLKKLANEDVKGQNFAAEPLLDVSLRILLVPIEPNTYI